jgi:hypothetical protein
MITIVLKRYMYMQQAFSHALNAPLPHPQVKEEKKESFTEFIHRFMPL